MTTTMHYLHGMPMGRMCDQIGIGPGSLVDVCHRLSRLCAHVPEGLIEHYRTAPVTHADEPGWRTEGKNGYAWVFATPTLSMFSFARRGRPRCPERSLAKRPCLAREWLIGTPATTRSRARFSPAPHICCGKLNAENRSVPMPPTSQPVPALWRRCWRWPWACAISTSRTHTSLPPVPT